MEIYSEEFNCYNTEIGGEDIILDYLEKDENNIVIGVKIEDSITIYCDNIHNFRLIPYLIEGQEYYVNNRIGNYIISKIDYEYHFEFMENRIFLLEVIDFIDSRYNLCEVNGYTFDEYKNIIGWNELEF